MELMAELEEMQMEEQIIIREEMPQRIVVIRHLHFLLIIQLIHLEVEVEKVVVVTTVAVMLAILVDLLEME